MAVYVKLIDGVGSKNERLVTVKRCEKIIKDATIGWKRIVAANVPFIPTKRMETKRKVRHTEIDREDGMIPTKSR